MKTTDRFVRRFAWIWFSLCFLALPALAQNVPDTAKAGDQPPTQSMMADSPVTAYTAGVMGYMILVGVEVSVLLGGAFVVINVGLLSKRDEDSVGHRDPSDVDLLSERLWPESEKFHRPILPAEEDEDQVVLNAMHPHCDDLSKIILLHEDQMYPDSSRKDGSHRDGKAA